MIFKQITTKYDIYYQKDYSDNKVPIIILSHGFKGWKDWGFFPFICEQFTRKGAIVICHNFSLNGNPDDTGFITNLENFAKNTISQEIQDLNNLINDIENGRIIEFGLISDTWNGEILLAGHSLGGGISLISGFNYKIIKKILLLASVGKFNRYSARQIEIWKQKGYMEFSNQKTNQVLRMDFTYIEDIIRNKDSFELTKLVEKYDKPILLIHGKQDLTVPLKEIEPIINSDKNQLVTKYILEKTGHTFGIEHPFSLKNEHLEKIIKISSDFFCLNQN